jgi:hypothetical protein
VRVKLAARLLPLASIFLALCATSQAILPAAVVFKGREKFDQLVRLAESGKWSALPIGERTGAVGRALVGTPYKSYTLEIDDRIEAPSVNLNGLDCWTFFESALAFARMLGEPREQWSPERMLHWIEIDRYRDGECTGSYLSRLHYLEEWVIDNDRRGLVQDLTRALGGSRVRHTANEMTVNWRSYRYMRSNPALRSGIRQMEKRVASLPMAHIPRGRVAGIESQLRTGDIISITTRDSGGIGTSHVGLAYRTGDGVLHFMHASSPRNHGRVTLDSRLSTYLHRFGSIAGIMVARPLR